MGLTILEVCALRKLIDVKKPCSDICNKLTLEYSQGQRNHPVAYLAQVLWVLNNMTTVISKHFGASIFMEIFA